VRIRLPADIRSNFRTGGGLDVHARGKPGRPSLVPSGTAAGGAGAPA
jgi:hypothetical protein